MPSSTDLRVTVSRIHKIGFSFIRWLIGFANLDSKATTEEKKFIFGDISLKNKICRVDSWCSAIGDDTRKRFCFVDLLRRWSCCGKNSVCNIEPASLIFSNTNMFRSWRWKCIVFYWNSKFELILDFLVKVQEHGVLKTATFCARRRLLCFYS